MASLIQNSPPSVRALLFSLFGVILTAIYCLAYNALSGSRESVLEALAWGIVNVAPWIAAAEMGRHLARWGQVAAVLAAAFLASLVLGGAFSGEVPGGFEWLRRLPGLLAAGAAIAGLHALRRRAERGSRAALPETADWTACDWIRAAGNYLELHRRGQTPQLVRATLAAILERRGDAFVRIHRSFLVRRAAIERIDRDSVVLRCGKRLPLGSTYRADFARR